jgi:hypothetical protein
MITELYINGQRLDLFDDVDINITYSVQDIENPTNRQSNFSRTIQIPSTTSNDNIFGSIYLFNTWVVDFDPSIKADCLILQSGNQVFEGVAQLLAIKQNESGRTYEIGLYGETANLFKTIGDAELTDLDFSDLNHVWDSTNIEDSWNFSETADGTGYYYPFIDYGQNFERQNTAPASFLYTVEDFYPAIYLKEYVDRIFEAAGFTYESNFLNGANGSVFKQLIVPYGVSGVPYITNEQALGNLYWVRLNADLTRNNLIPVTQFQFGTATPSPYFNSGSYNLSTRKFIAPADRTYNFQLRVTATLVQATGPFNSVALTSNLYKNGTVVTPNMVVLWDINTPANTTITQDFFIQDTATVGDEYEIRYQGGAIGYTILIDSSNTYWLNQIAGTPKMEPGDLWDMNETVVPKVKQSELLSSVISMFNLYVYPDKYNQKKLYIEPWSEFFDQGVVDWTDLWDLNKGFEVLPSGFYNPKTFKFSYKNGGSFFEKRYQQSYTQGYGTRIYNVENEFNTGDVSKEIVAGCGIMAGYTSSSRIAPRFFDQDQNGNIKPVAPGFRILFGRYASYPKDAGFFVFETNPFDKYPYAGTLDNPYNPTLDILFGVPRELYYSNNTETNTIYRYTDGNLFNTYWKNFVDTYTNKDAKKIIAYLQLTPVDMNNLDFRKLIYINGVLFYLLSVTDYKPNNDESTKVELLKVLNLPVFVPTTFELTNGTGAFINDEPKPQIITD